MSLRHEVPFRTGELPVDNLGLEIDSRGRIADRRGGQTKAPVNSLCDISYYMIVLAKVDYTGNKP